MVAGHLNTCWARWCGGDSENNRAARSSAYQPSKDSERSADSSQSWCEEGGIPPQGVHLFRQGPSGAAGPRMLQQETQVRKLIHLLPYNVPWLPERDVEPSWTNRHSGCVVRLSSPATFLSRGRHLSQGPCRQQRPAALPSLPCGGAPSHQGEAECCCAPAQVSCGDQENDNGARPHCRPRDFLGGGGTAGVPPRVQWLSREDQFAGKHFRFRRLG